MNLGDGLRCLLGTCPIAPRNPTELQLIDWDEIRTFKTQKRSDEHLPARWLLEQALHEWGNIDCSQINVARTEERPLPGGYPRVVDSTEVTQYLNHAQ